MKNTLISSGGDFARNPEKVRYIIVHCSATPRNRDIGAAEIRAWHLQRGFRDIGYHFVVRLDGTVETGRPLHETGAHCLGQNKHSVGVCYVGGVGSDGKTPADTRTPEQKMQLATLIRELRKRFPSAEVRSHRDFAPKACPSFDATKEYAVLTARLLPVVAVLTLTGCKSEKSVVATTESIALTEETTATRGDTRLVVDDSLDIVLFSPRMEIKTADSTSVVITAEKLTAGRHTQSVAAETTESITESVATGRLTHDIDSHSETAAVAPFPLLSAVVIGLTILAAICLAKKFGARLKKRLFANDTSDTKPRDRNN